MGTAAKPLAPLLDPATRAPIIDLRSHALANAKHIKGALHLDAREWWDRSLEIPPRGRPIALVADKSADCAAILHHIATTFKGGGDVTAIYQDDDEAFWSSLPAAAVGSGPPPSVRLWEPSPLLPVLLSHWHQWMPHAPRPVLLDAGAGAARNAIYFAQELPGSRVVCVDNRDAMVEKASAFVQRVGAAEAVTVVEADIVDYLHSYDTAVDGPCFDAVLFCRFHLVEAMQLAARVLAHRKLRNRAGAAAAASPSAAAEEELQNDAVLLVIESFHTSTTHPKQRNQQLAEGEALTFMGVSAAEASADAGSGAGAGGEEAGGRVAAAGDLHVEQLWEQRAPAEDGRPLLQVVLRIRAVPR